MKDQIEKNKKNIVKQIQKLKNSTEFMKWLRNVCFRYLVTELENGDGDSLSMSFKATNQKIKKEKRYKIFFTEVNKEQKNE